MNRERKINEIWQQQQQTFKDQMQVASRILFFFFFFCKNKLNAKICFDKILKQNQYFSIVQLLFYLKTKTFFSADFLNYSKSSNKINHHN